ncbi:hypothetical protein U1Q18_040350 [Sarracenia purpurea var. burkii]
MFDKGSGTSEGSSQPDIEFPNVLGEIPKPILRGNHEGDSENEDEKEASGGKSKRPSVFGSDTKGAKDSAGKTEEITEQNLSSGEDDDSEEDETSSNGGTKDLESGPCEFEISAEEEARSFHVSTSLHEGYEILDLNDDKVEPGDVGEAVDYHCHRFGQVSSKMNFFDSVSSDNVCTKPSQGAEVKGGSTNQPSLQSHGAAQLDALLKPSCGMNWTRVVASDEGWTKVGKGKGKDLGEQPVSHALDFPSSSNPILSKGDGQKSEIAEKGKEIQVEVNEQSEKSAQDINVTEEEMAKPDKNKQVASLSGSEREGSDDVSMEIISDDFDRPVVSPKAPPDKKQSSNKKKKKR